MSKKPKAQVEEEEFNEYVSLLSGLAEIDTTFIEDRWDMLDLSAKLKSFMHALDTLSYINAQIKSVVDIKAEEKFEQNHRATEIIIDSLENVGRHAHTWCSKLNTSFSNLQKLKKYLNIMLNLPELDTLLNFKTITRKNQWLQSKVETEQRFYTATLATEEYVRFITNLFNVPQEADGLLPDLGTVSSFVEKYESQYQKELRQIKAFLPKMKSFEDAFTQLKLDVEDTLDSFSIIFSDTLINIQTFTHTMKETTSGNLFAIKEHAMAVLQEIMSVKESLKSLQFSPELVVQGRGHANRSTPPIEGANGGGGGAGGSLKKIRLTEVLTFMEKSEEFLMMHDRCQKYRKSFDKIYTTLHRSLTQLSLECSIHSEELISRKHAFVYKPEFVSYYKVNYSDLLLQYGVAIEHIDTMLANLNISILNYESEYKVKTANGDINGQTTTLQDNLKKNQQLENERLLRSNKDKIDANLEMLASDCMKFWHLLFKFNESAVKRFFDCQRRLQDNLIETDAKLQQTRQVLKNREAMGIVEQKRKELGQYLHEKYDVLKSEKTRAEENFRNLARTINIVRVAAAFKKKIDEVMGNYKKSFARKITEFSHNNSPRSSMAGKSLSHSTTKVSTEEDDQTSVFSVANKLMDHTKVPTGDDKSPRHEMDTISITSETTSTTATTVATKGIPNFDTKSNSRGQSAVDQIVRKTARNQGFTSEAVKAMNAVRTPGGGGRNTGKFRPHSPGKSIKKSNTSKSSLAGIKETHSESSDGDGNGINVFSDEDANMLVTRSDDDDDEDDDTDTNESRGSRHKLTIPMSTSPKVSSPRGHRRNETQASSNPRVSRLKVSADYEEWNEKSRVLLRMKQILTRMEEIELDILDYSDVQTQKSRVRQVVGYIDLIRSLAPSDIPDNSIDQINTLEGLIERLYQMSRDIGKVDKVMHSYRLNKDSIPR